MVSLFNKSVNMSKFVAVILENDVINSVDINSCKEALEHYIIIIENIVKDFNKIVDKFRLILPAYAARPNWPKLVFILPTLHRSYNDYEHRKVFIETIETVCKNQNNVWPVKLLHVWDKNDARLFNKNDQKHTREGMETLWAAIDNTLAFCNRKLHREDAKMKPQAPVNDAEPSLDRGDEPANTGPSSRRYTWHRGNRGRQSNDRQYRLPPPPAAAGSSRSSSSYDNSSYYF